MFEIIGIMRLYMFLSKLEGKIIPEKEKKIVPIVTND